MRYLRDSSFCGLLASVLSKGRTLQVPSFENIYKDTIQKRFKGQYCQMSQSTLLFHCVTQLYCHLLINQIVQVGKQVLSTSSISASLQKTTIPHFKCLVHNISSLTWPTFFDRYTKTHFPNFPYTKHTKSPCIHKILNHTNKQAPPYSHS